MDQQKLPYEYLKQSVIYNGYVPTETTLGTIFGSEVLPPLEISIQEKCLTATDHVKQQSWQQKCLRIINVYGPAEAYIVSTDTAIKER